MIHWLDVIIYIFGLFLINYIANDINRDDNSDVFIEIVSKFFTMLIFSIIYILIFGVFDNNWSDILNIDGKFWIGSGDNKIIFNL